MQVTLVAFYGPDKPLEFGHLISECQSRLGGLLGGGFAPYPVEQVHATIVGLEGTVRGSDILNRNFQDIGQERPMALDGLIDLWRNLKPFEVQIAAWSEAMSRGFQNRMGEAPYRGSFFIRGGLAGAMGWPVRRGGGTTDSREDLYDLRKEIEAKANILHRWHRDPNSRDNDLFFRLGINPAPDADPVVEQARVEMRRFMAEHKPVFLTVRPEDLSAVAYTDNTLPWHPDSSRRCGVRDITEDWLRRAYDR